MQIFAVAPRLVSNLQKEEAVVLVHPEVTSVQAQEHAAFLARTMNIQVLAGAADGAGPKVCQTICLGSETEGCMKCSKKYKI